jgi:hypothetical protein
MRGACALRVGGLLGMAVALMANSAASGIICEGCRLERTGLCVLAVILSFFHGSCVCASLLSDGENDFFACGAGFGTGIEDIVKDTCCVGSFVPGPCEESLSVVLACDTPLLAFWSALLFAEDMFSEE